MLLPIVLVLFLALILFALLRPLLRPPAADPDRGSVSVMVFRDQLAEIARDREAGLLNTAEAGAAKIELERRLLSVTGNKVVSSNPATPHAGWIAGIAVAILVPVIAIPLYLLMGAPALPDQPFAMRAQERELVSADGNLDLDKARIALEAKLKQDPGSVEGWIFLARTDAALGRADESHRAFEKALTLSNRRPDILEAYGETLVGSGTGTIPAEARALFAEAIKASPKVYGARYALALGKAQDGDLSGAIADWSQLEQEAPADATWLSTVKAAISSAKQQLAGGAAPTVDAPQAPPREVAAIAKLPPAEQLDAIKGMVAGLAARLAREPNDLDGWKRLGRAYLVLGDNAAAADAYGKAAALAPQDADLALLRAQALRGNAETMSDQAADAYGKVNALAPDQPEALFFLGMAAKQRGDPKTAKARWTRLLPLLTPSSDEAQEVAKQLALLP